jgi:2-methylcitrate dehydratase PrpD
MDIISGELASFAVETKYEELPFDVVHEAKRVLLDSVGCALAGITTDRAKMTIALSRRLGGSAESTIIGIGDKVSCSSAALANGELITTPDYHAIIYPGGNLPPHVIPAPLAIGESVRTSGKDLILAIVLGLEIAARVSSATPSFSSFEGAEGRVKWAYRYGQASCNFGAAAAAGRILKLDKEKMLNALGIAGHLSQVPTHAKLSFSPKRAMTKYASAGWQSTGAVIAALLAEMGYIGDTAVFDTEYGFWRFAGFDEWNPEKVTKDIGKAWYFLEAYYKLYPCCRMFHTALDCFISIMEKNNLMPEDIESVTAFCHPSVEAPLFTSNQLVSTVDAQFNPAYVFAVAAHKVRVGIEWQDIDTMRDTKIIAFMQKVKCKAHPDYGRTRQKYPKSHLGMVEVVAKGNTFREERMYHRGFPIENFRVTDEELIVKFKHNASRILRRDKIERAVKALLELETMEDVAGLMEQVSL